MGKSKAIQAVWWGGSDLDPDVLRHMVNDEPKLGVELNERDQAALVKVARMVACNEMRIAEVGSWKGDSTALLAKVIMEHNGKIFCIDHWLGSPVVPQHYEVAKTADIYLIFRRNMINQGVWDVVCPMIMDSQTAVDIFRDEILDLVFIDADHRYSCVKSDIEAWYPKIKTGGILCGHDCHEYYHKYSDAVRKRIEEHLEEDYISPEEIHPGVVKALDTCFQEKYSIMPNSWVWYIQKDKGIW